MYTLTHALQSHVRDTWFDAVPLLGRPASCTYTLLSCLYVPSGVKVDFLPLLFFFLFFFFDTFLIHGPFWMSWVL